MPAGPCEHGLSFRKSVRDFSFSFLLKFLFGKALFGRSLAQLILAALSFYPFGVKEKPKRRFLSDVLFGELCLDMYPSADFAASGASWQFWVVLGWILVCWDLRGWNMAFWILALAFPRKVPWSPPWGPWATGAEGARRSSSSRVFINTKFWGWPRK